MMGWKIRTTSRCDMMMTDQACDSSMFSSILMKPLWLIQSSLRNFVLKLQKIQHHTFFIPTILQGKSLKQLLFIYQYKFANEICWIYSGRLNSVREFMSLDWCYKYYLFLCYYLFDWCFAQFWWRFCFWQQSALWWRKSTDISRNTFAKETREPQFCSFIDLLLYLSIPVLIFVRAI